MKVNLRSKVYCILLFVLLGTTKIANATHVQGGNVTYTCLGGNQYQIKLALYRDCAGVAAPNSASLNYQSVSCNINLTVTLNKVAGTGIEVTPICSSLITQCAGGTFPGVQEYIYSGIVTLPPCSDWVLSYNLSARNNAINTIASPGAQNMYIEATLNNLAFPCNSSPTFTNKPVPFICVGQPFCFNNGSNDSEGDSLTYSLVTPMNNPGSFVTYLAPYSAIQPLLSSPAATFNPATGDMCVTPTSIQVTVFAILVKEWRNGVLVGSVTRDIQVRTIACTNNNPYLNGINNTGAYTINACAGSPLSFNIPSFDVDGSQNVTLSWNAGITGASFNPGTGTRPIGIFSWTPTTADVSNIAYCFTVKVTDNNCPFNGSQTYSFCINVGGITASVTSTNATCTAPNGSATISASGGVIHFTYSWTPAVSSTSTANKLVAGTYTYTVTDALGCSKTGTVTIISNPGGTAGISTFKNVSCSGLSDGAITVSTGGNFTTPFIYAWSPSSAGTTNNISNLSAGNYSVTVTDANGCSASATQIITQPPLLKVNPTYTNVGCNGGSSGTATGAVTGGTGPYTFLWLPGAFSTSSITSLPIGSYSLSVTDSKGCTTSGIVNITQPPILSITSTSIGANCGQPNGTATVSGSGGFAPYTWTWSNGQTGPNATGLSAGTYIVTITDVNLCTQKAAVTIGNIAGPTATISSNNIYCNGGNNGNATISVSGGTPSFTYLWSNGQTTPTASNLVPGIYSVNAKDATGCIVAKTVTITQPSILVANTVKTNPTCFGNSDGTALVNATGGTLPYSYLWTSAGNPTTGSITGLPAGTYNVTITDGKGCVQIKSITLTNPPTVTANVSVVPVSCNGGCNGTATASITNGTAPFTYVWNSPVNQFNATATNLCAGSYTLNVSDGNGCTSKAVATITQPSALTSTISSTGNLICYGVCTGFAQIIPSGASAPYTYSWMPGGITSALAKNLCAGSYTCTVSDSKGCTSVQVTTITQPAQLKATITGTNINCFGTCDGTGNINFSGGVPPYNFLWTPGLQKTFNPSNLCTGLNTANITDANGCSVSGSINLTEAYTPLVVTTSTNNSNCGQGNGSACAVVSGGLAPYTYIWNDSAVTKISCATLLKSGSYNVDVIDANGCVKTQVANINDISGPTVNITSHTDLLCFGFNNATAITSISGGALPYSILWTPGGQTIANPTNLAAGVNTVTVKDNAGCSSSASVIILEPPAIVHSISGSINASCFNLCNGSAKIIAAGGTGTLTYLWNDPTLQTTITASNLCSGNYKVVIKDANGCTANDSVVITKPTPLLVINSSTKNITCFGDNNGVITTTTSGGTPFYTYSWTPNISNNAFANSLSAGNYSLTITDLNGCSAAANWTITQPIALTDTSGFAAATCGKANGSALITPFGGTPPYIYQWNNPSLQTTSSIGNLFPGNYNVLVTDAHGCTVSKNYLIADKSGPTIDSVSSLPAVCFG
ncbi:MAG: SprB repeat-containing protein, partial [Bacteroidetes bacterium]|nr:SprB repeat-containing protein [Bacteroidota bacterium]